MQETPQNIRNRVKEEFLKCANDPVYFMRKYYTIQHPTKGRMLFNLYDFQEKVLKLYQNNEYCIINKSRQLGISTLVSAYSLWLMLFQRDKNILVVATTQMTAKNMVTKVRFAYQNLPTWLKIGHTEDNRLSLRLVNGSQIKAVSAAGDATRSEAVTLLVIDEAAFIDRIEDIFTAAQQTLATGGRCIALSTPNGVGNWFHKMFTKAQKKENNFLPISLPWTVHPERDPIWRSQQDKDLGVRAAAQECDCDFATSGNSFIDPEILTWYEENTISEPIERRGMDKSLWIWEYVEPLANYAVIADVARGDGSDYSTFHVIDVERVTQVAEYKAQIDTREFARILLAIANEYNQALLVVENANIGWDVVQSIVESGYQNVYYGYSQSNDDFQKYMDRFDRNSGMVPGFTTTQKSRPLILERLRDFVENKVVVIRSIRLLEELRVFVWKNNKQQAMQGYNDDLVMTLSIGLYLRETSLRFKKTIDSLTAAGINNIGRSGTPQGMISDNNQYSQYNQWTQEISTPLGQENIDLTWLIM
jgi:hypothetical protein